MKEELIKELDLWIQKINSFKGTLSKSNNTPARRVVNGKIQVLKDVIELIKSK